MDNYGYMTVDMSIYIYICPPWAIVQAIVIYAEPNLAKD